MSSDHCFRNLGTLHGCAMQALAVVACSFAITFLGCGGGGAGLNNSGERAGKGPVAASVSSTIAVGTAPSAIAVDSTTNKIYIADFGTKPAMSSSQLCSSTGADITAIDGVTESATVLSLAPSSNPFAMALKPATHTVYVLVDEFGMGVTGKGCALGLYSVAVIDTSTLKGSGAVYQVPAIIGDLLSGIAVNPSNADIYVTEYAHSGALTANSVIVIDGAEKASVTVGSDAKGIAVNATTNKIYVANSGSDDVSVIDGSNNSVVATITDPSALGPIAIAVNATTNTIYVANSHSNNLTVIDGSNNAVTATIPVGISPSGVDVDPQTNFVYVVNAGNSQAGDPGNVTVINGTTNATTMLLDPNAKNPVAVAVNPVTNKIYVANSGSGNVTVISGAHN